MTDDRSEMRDKIYQLSSISSHLLRNWFLISLILADFNFSHFRGERFGNPCDEKPL